MCKGWRKAQRKVGGPLRTRVASDVVLLGQVAPVKWALAEGRPRDGKVEPFEGFNMAEFAADAGRFELVQGLLLEGGFQLLDKQLLGWAAARGGNGMELVQWLAAAGLPLDPGVAVGAAESGQLELVKWLFAAPREARS